MVEVIWYGDMVWFYIFGDFVKWTKEGTLKLSPKSSLLGGEGCSVIL